jgi:site-specific DNA recombinase
VRAPFLLKGVLFDAEGNRFSPMQTRKGGRTYRYYVNQRVLQFEKLPAQAIRRLPAESLEQAVLNAVIKAEKDDEHEHMWGHDGLEHDAVAQHAAWRQRIRRVEVGVDHLCITVAGRDAKDNNAIQTVVDAGHSTTSSPVRVLDVPWTLVRRGGRTELRVPGVPTQPKSQFHEELIAAVVRALQWKDDLIEGRIPSIKALAQREQLDRRYVMRMLRLSFLAPDLIEAILIGWQPPELTLERFRRPIPLEWAMQRKYFSFPSSSSVGPQRAPKS